MLGPIRIYVRVSSHIGFEEDPTKQYSADMINEYLFPHLFASVLYLTQ